MLLGSKWRIAASVSAFVCLLGPSSAAFAGDDYSHLSASKYLASPDLFVTLSGRVIGGELQREGGDFFKVRDLNGKVVGDPAVKFSGRGAVSGFDGEAAVGKWFGAMAYELVVGGGVVVSEATSDGRISLDELSSRLLTIGAPCISCNVSFRGSSGQFDVERVSYRNTYDRNEVFAGVRMTTLLGSWAAGKDASRIQPMAYVSFGETTVGETFDGATASQKIQFGYDNAVTSSFSGVGGGVGASGLLGEIAKVRIGYFGALRGGLEFQQATGSSQWDLRPSSSLTGVIGTNFSRSSQKLSSHHMTKDVEAEETTVALQGEAGISMALMTGVDVELGARVRRLDTPQVVVNGEEDAHIKFTTSEELSGFFGLKAEF